MVGVFPFPNTDSICECQILKAETGDTGGSPSLQVQSRDYGPRGSLILRVPPTGTSTSDLGRVGTDDLTTEISITSLELLSRDYRFTPLFCGRKRPCRSPGCFRSPVSPGREGGHRVPSGQWEGGPMCRRRGGV